MLLITALLTTLFAYLLGIAIIQRALQLPLSATHRNKN